MKKILFVLFVWCIIAGIAVVKTVSRPKTSAEGTAILNTLSQGGCSAKAPRDQHFVVSTNPSIRRLGEFDKKCASAVTDSLMYFTIMPKDSLVAKELAGKVAATIQIYHDNGIKPIVIIEPDSAWGLIDFNEFNTGFYDVWISDFFKELVRLGITSDTMGTWVPFPEANLPYWNHQNTKPEDFSKAVNRYLGILRKYYPDTKTSILLNSATYPTDDYNWADGEYLSLAPYVSGLDKKLVDSFGLQGLPWMSPANTVTRYVFEPTEFLNTKIAKEAADIIGTKDIWFNTGTFASKYAQEPEKKVLVPASVRKEMLDKIHRQALDLKKSGYNVSVNIFAEDKSGTAEATDWSYWGSDDTQNTSHELAIINFLKDLHSEGIGVSFYLR